jgi:hypothetical protein
VSVLRQCVAALAAGVGLSVASMAPAGAQPAAAVHGDDLAGVWNNLPIEGTGDFQGWAFSRDPPPMTAWARERFEAARPTFGPRGVTATESNDPVYDCYPPGLPRVYFHPFPFEIVQLPGRVLMMFEYHHQNRQIYTDSRGHREDLPPLWSGDSIGRWEGGTLVVETVNFNDQTWLDRQGLPHSDQLKVTERIRRIGPDLLEIDFAIEDPLAYPVPITGRRLYERVDWQIEEFACMERNRSDDFADFESQILEHGETERQ